MQMLIDGHNLIAKLPDLDLTDEEDEAQLVARLRTYAYQKRRQVTVVFDHGMPGGRSDLSSGPVEVVFSSTGRQADGIIQERILGARDTQGIIVVSSDRRIVRAAERRRMRVVRSEEFAEELARPAEEEAPMAPKPPPPADADEIAEWLDVFRSEG
jgi:hypothetical protein